MTPTPTIADQLFFGGTLLGSTTIVAMDDWVTRVAGMLLIVGSMFISASR